LVNDVRRIAGLNQVAWPQLRPCAMVEPLIPEVIGGSTNAFVHSVFSQSAIRLLVVRENHKGPVPIPSLPYPSQRLGQWRQCHYAAIPERHDRRRRAIENDKIRAGHSEVKSRDINGGIVNASHKWRKEIIPDLIPPAKEAA